MHTTVYQFWRFVYHLEQSVIDHYARSSFYTRSFCTAIKLYVSHFLWPRRPHLLHPLLHASLWCWYWQSNFPMNPYDSPLVDWLVIIKKKTGKLHFQCSYQSIRLLHKKCWKKCKYNFYNMYIHTYMHKHIFTIHLSINEY